MTNGVNERPYLSIGEVLGLLLEEFPDVTISKIRFLESQGLIEPERTSSGYRKFFDSDIDRLKVILHEQKQNFLPLRVIRDRLETGEIDDSGPIAMPETSSTPPAGTVSPMNRGIRNVTVVAPDFDDTDGFDRDDPTGSVSAGGAAVVTDRHPAAQARGSVASSTPDTALRSVALLDSTGPISWISRDDLRDAGGLTDEQLNDLISFGLITPRGSSSSEIFSDGDIDVARIAVSFFERGIDVRHLRGWRQSAEREATLFEQRILPLLRQRNPQAKTDALALLSEFAELGGALRDALMVSMLRHHLEA